MARIKQQKTLKRRGEGRMCVGWLDCSARRLVTPLTHTLFLRCYGVISQIEYGECSMSHRILAVLPIIALTGCATMSADQCATADWHALGFEDGSKGETLVKAERRGNACADHGYAMNRAVEDKGRHGGLGRYWPSDVS